MTDLDDLVPPLSARSVLLTVLLGVVPPRLSAQELVMIGRYFDLAESTVRAALSRMTTSGDLDSRAGVYSLSKKHLERQERTELLVTPRLLPHTGTWRTIVLTGTGRPAAERAETRAGLLTGRYGELREGVWMRPDNLAGPLPPIPTTHITLLTTPADEQALAAQLWDLEGWAAEARAVLGLLRGGGDNLLRLRATAAAVRLLTTDPALPDELRPAGWPADKLRWAQEDYRRELTTIHISRLSGMSQTV